MIKSFPNAISLRFSRVSFGHSNDSTHKIRVIQFSDRFINAFFLHFYKAKTFRFFRFSVINQLDIKHLAKLAKKLLDFLASSTINQIPYINVSQSEILR